MKVIEEIKNNRTGEVSEVSWGNNITSDLGVLNCIVSILAARQERTSGETNPISRNLTTISVTIEF